MTLPLDTAAMRKVLDRIAEAAQREAQQVALQAVVVARAIIAEVERTRTKG